MKSFSSGQVTAIARTERFKYLQGQVTDIIKTQRFKYLEGQVTAIARTQRFKYLESMLSSNGELCNEIVSHINATWMKWHSPTGVLCDRCINERLKSKIHCNVVRSVALYGSECWATIKDNERRLAVMETKMVHCTGGVTRFNHV